MHSIPYGLSDCRRLEFGNSAGREATVRGRKRLSLAVVVISGRLFLVVAAWQPNLAPPQIEVFWNA